MNNIYVDELPKKGACFNGCPYAVTDTWVYYCPFQQDENGDHLIVEEDCIKACPLKLVTDRLAEERKKVVQEIRNWCDKNFNWVGDRTGYDGQDYNEMIGSNKTINKLRESLDQIERNNV